MFTPRIRHFFPVMILMIASSCHTIKTEGTTKAIMTGDVFSGCTVKDPGPMDYTAVEKRETKPPLRWKVDF